MSLVTRAMTAGSDHARDEKVLLDVQPDFGM